MLIEVRHGNYGEMELVLKSLNTSRDLKRLHKSTNLLAKRREIPLFDRLKLLSLSGDVISIIMPLAQINTAGGINVKMKEKR